MHLKFLMLLLLIGIAFACNERETLTESEKEAVISEIRHTLENYYAEIREWGLAAEFTYLDSSDNFFWVPPGADMALSYDSISKILNKNASAYQSINNTWDTLAIIPFTRTHAVYTGTINSEIIDSAGSKTKAKLVETGVLIKRETGWRLISGQTAVIPD